MERPSVGDIMRGVAKALAYVVGQMMEALQAAGQAAQVPVVEQDVRPANQELLELQYVLKLKQSAFRGQLDPLLAEEWLRQMVRRLDMLGISMECRVTLASHFLEGPAYSWWVSEQREQGPDMTWAQFEAAFREKYVPLIVHETKAQELLELRQESRTVAEYDELVKFGGMYVQDEAATAAKFRMGLYPAMAGKFATTTRTTSDREVVELARMAEKINQDTKEYYNSMNLQKRGEASSSEARGEMAEKSNQDSKKYYDDIKSQKRGESSSLDARGEMTEKNNQETKKYYDSMKSQKRGESSSLDARGEMAEKNNQNTKKYYDSMKSQKRGESSSSDTRGEMAEKSNQDTKKCNDIMKSQKRGECSSSNARGEMAEKSNQDTKKCNDIMKSQKRGECSSSNARGEKKKKTEQDSRRRSDRRDNPQNRAIRKMEIGGVDEERRIGHYRGVDKILLVGEGDFSFALCLAKAFGSARNMVATSLDSKAKLLEQYSKVAENLKMLMELGCKILHKVNAHSMSQNPKLKQELFDRIVFNFPHAGFRYEENWDEQIELHKQLVKGFFSSARNMLKENGQVHVTHKTYDPFSRWNVKELAEKAGLELTKEVEFDRGKYPGYVSKRGDGSGADRKYPVGESSTFMFRSVDNERCIGQYRSVDKMLLVGEGDFSFALCLAKAFGSARNMVATSLDSKAKLRQKYSKVAENLKKLGELGCTILHKVNAHSMSQNPKLNGELFDRIVFNFPHAGFHYSEHQDEQIELHKQLLKGFFSSARHMLKENGQVHITHKTTQPFNKWNVKKLAKKVGLKLSDEVEFDKGSYPGYKNKRGDGSRSDEAFPVGESSTYIFHLNA